MITKCPPYENAYAVQRDEKAFNELVSLHSPTLLPMIAGITRCSYAAEDILQETFIKLWFRKEAPDNPGGWLYRVAINAAFRYLQNENKRTMLLNEFKEINKHACLLAESSLINKERKMQLAQIFTRLPQMQQKVFWLSREAGLSRDEIAGKLEISCNTVRVHLTRAQRFFKSQLTAVSIFLLFFGFAFICSNTGNTKNQMEDLDITEEKTSEISPVSIVKPAFTLITHTRKNDTQNRKPLA